METYATLAGTNLRRLKIPFTQGAAPCRVGSAETTCARVLCQLNDGTRVVLWGMARVRERLLVAHCTGPYGSPLPEPCSSVFDLR